MNSRALVEAREDLNKLKAKIAEAKQDHGHKIKAVVFTTGGAAVAGLLGFASKRWPDRMQVANIPFTALGGIAALAGAFEVSGNENVNAALFEGGKASLYTYSALMGADKGQAAKDAAGG